MKNRLRPEIGLKLLLLLGMLFVLLLFTLPFWSSTRIPYQGDVINSDVTEYNFPIKVFYAQSLREGKLPFWVHELGCGFPLLAEGQSGLLYPLNLLLYRFASPIPAFNLSIIVSLALCLLFSYLLFREYELSRGASFFSSVAFTFSGYTMARLKFNYLVLSLGWTPLAVLGLEKSFRHRNFAYILLTVLALSMQILAGGPQLFMITLSLLGFLFLWRYLTSLGRLRSPEEETDRRAARRAAVIPLLSIVICVLLALSLAGPQLVPMLKGYTVSDRAMNQTFDFSLGVSMQPRNLAMLFSPYQYGNPARNTYDLHRDYFWEDIAYPGLLTSVLALLALFIFRLRDETTLMWCAAGVLALMISLGALTPFAEFLWRYIPGFRFFRFWQRFLVVMVLSLSYLAGKGLDAVLGRVGPGKLWRFSVATLCIGVLLVDLGLFSYQQVTTIDASRLMKDNPTAEALKERLESGGSGPLQRVAMVGGEDLWKEVMRQSRGWLGDKDVLQGFFLFLPPNHNLLFGLSSFSQYGDYGIYRFKLLDDMAHYFYVRDEDWKGRLTDTAVNILALFGVRYLISPLKLDQEGLRLVEVEDTPIRGVTLKIYEIEDPLPAARMVQDVRVLETGESVGFSQIMEALWNGESSRNSVILEERLGEQFGPGSPGEAEITYLSSARISVSADTPGGGTLILSSAYYPEWHVYVDGEERELLRVNFAAMGVVLGPGKHEVEFVFRPVSFYYGIFLSAASILLTALLWIWTRKMGYLRLR